MSERYYTIKQAAAILGVTPLTLRNWDKKGLLVAHRNPINNYRLYRYADVADFLADIRRSGPREPRAGRLRVRQEDEAADGGILVSDAEVRQYGEQLADTEFSEEPPASYDAEAPFGIPVERTATAEEQSDTGAV